MNEDKVSWVGLNQPDWMWEGNDIGTQHSEWGWSAGTEHGGIAQKRGLIRKPSQSGAVARALQGKVKNLSFGSYCSNTRNVMETGMISGALRGSLELSLGILHFCALKHHQSHTFFLDSYSLSGSTQEDTLGLHWRRHSSPHCSATVVDQCCPSLGYVNGHSWL